MRVKHAVVGASLTLLSWCAQAVPFINFATDTACSGQTTCTKTLTDASATAMFANPLAEAPLANAFYLGAGLGLGLGSGGIGYQWTVTFDATVALIGVELGFSFDNAGFDVAGAGVNADDLLVGAGLGVHALNPITFLANESYTFTSNNSCTENNCGAILFRNWEFQGPGIAQAAATDTRIANVPEPGILAMLGLGAVGLFAVRRKE